MLEDEVTHDVKQFAKILERCRGRGLRKCTPAQLAVAWKWAQYFQQIFRTIAECTPERVNKCDRQIRLLCQSFNSRGGVGVASMMCFDFLVDAERNLLRLLTTNQHTPSNVFGEVCGLYPNVDDLSEDIAHAAHIVAKCKVMTRMLSLLRKSTRATPPDHSSGISMGRVMSEQESVSYVHTKVPHRENADIYNSAHPCTDTISTSDSMKIYDQAPDCIPSLFSDHGLAYDTALHTKQPCSPSDINIDDELVVPGCLFSTSPSSTHSPTYAKNCVPANAPRYDTEPLNIVSIGAEHLKVGVAGVKRSETHGGKSIHERDDNTKNCGEKINRKVVEQDLPKDSRVSDNDMDRVSSMSVRLNIVGDVITQTDKRHKVYTSCACHPWCVPMPPTPTTAVAGLLLCLLRDCVENDTNGKTNHQSHFGTTPRPNTTTLEHGMNSSIANANNCAQSHSTPTPAYSAHRQNMTSPCLCTSMHCHTDECSTTCRNHPSSSLALNAELARLRGLFDRHPETVGVFMIALALTVVNTKTQIPTNSHSMSVDDFVARELAAWLVDTIVCTFSRRRTNTSSTNKHNPPSLLSRSLLSTVTRKVQMCVRAHFPALDEVYKRYLTETVHKD